MVRWSDGCSAGGPSPSAGEGGVVGKQHVFVGLSTRGQRGLAVRAEDDRGNRGAVVVVGHRVAVGPGQGYDDQVTDLRVDQLGRTHHQVPRLALAADDVADRVWYAVHRGRDHGV